MKASDLSDTERLAYEAGRADAEARCWQIDADLTERDTGRPGVAREYQREREAEAAAHWRRLAALKAEDAQPAGVAP